MWGLFKHSWQPAQAGEGCPQSACDGAESLMFGLLEAFFLAEDFGWGQTPPTCLLISHGGDSLRKA